MANDKPLFVERRKQGDYAVRKGDSERASIVYAGRGDQGREKNGP
jgi:hypothetical protein